MKFSHDFLWNFVTWIWIFSYMLASALTASTNSTTVEVTIAQTISKTNMTKTVIYTSTMHSTPTMVTAEIMSTTAAGSTESSTTGGSGEKRHMALAVGLGAGIPLVVITTAVILCCCYRRRKKDQGVQRMMPFNPMNNVRRLTSRDKKKSKASQDKKDTAGGQDNATYSHDGDQGYINVPKPAVIPSLQEEQKEQPHTKYEPQRQVSPKYVNLPKNSPEQIYQNTPPVQKKRKHRSPPPQPVQIYMNNSTETRGSADSNYYNLSQDPQRQRLPSDRDLYDPVEVSRTPQGVIYQNMDKSGNTRDMDRQTSQQYLELEAHSVQNTPSMYTDLD